MKWPLIWLALAVFVFPRLIRAAAQTLEMLR